MYRDGGPVTENQHQAFKDRVELVDGEMKDGDVSMILKNVTRDDAGTFECHVLQRERNDRTKKKRANLKNEAISTINLDVKSNEFNSGGTEERGDKEEGDKETGDKDGGDKERGEKNHHVGLAVGLPAVLLLVAGLVGVFFYIKHKGPTPVPPDEE